MNISVISFWEVPGLDHLVAFTDTGVNIQPDAKAKLEICEERPFCLPPIETAKAVT